MGAFREVMASISCIRQSLELERFEQGAPVIDRAATTSPATVSIDMRVWSAAPGRHLFWEIFKKYHTPWISLGVFMRA